MRVADFYFDLPDELIARYPKTERTASRLLQLNGENGDIFHRTFADVLELIHPGDLMIFNNTRVIPARMFGRKISGGKIEVLVERVLSESRFLAHVRASKAPKEGAELILGEDKLGEGNGVKALMVGRQGSLFEIEIAEKQTALFDVLQQIGHMPLPPYIDRPDEEADQERYQTVYNKVPGAVAAPTAGLHFDDELLEIITKEEKICKYVDIPLQHISDSVLRRMHRRDSSQSIKKLLKKLRNTTPYITIRTTLMVGFPGETEADFKELLTFIKAVKFDNMGAFTYSAQDGTPAARMVDQVTEEIKENRYHELMAAQAEISEENNRNLIGVDTEVLVEELLDDGCGNLQAKGRASFQAPEVDGNA